MLVVKGKGRCEINRRSVVVSDGTPGIARFQLLYLHFGKRFTLTEDEFHDRRKGTLRVMKEEHSH